MATRPSNLIVMRDSRFLVVMPGLDPGIHQNIKRLFTSDGLPGQARQ
jgi:hypothetical protein